MPAPGKNCEEQDFPEAGIWTSLLPGQRMQATGKIPFLPFGRDARAFVYSLRILFWLLFNQTATLSLVDWLHWMFLRYCRHESFLHFPRGLALSGQGSVLSQDHQVPFLILIVSCFWSKGHFPESKRLIATNCRDIEMKGIESYVSVMKILEGDSKQLGAKGFTQALSSFRWIHYDSAQDARIIFFAD